MSRFRNAVLLYRPSISIWTARKKDKEESAKVVDDNSATTGAASVYKALLPDNPILEKIRKSGDAFREFIYLRTAPWEDGGWRAGRVDLHMDFMATAGDKMRELEELFDEFCVSYSAARENARFQLNTLFKEGDYPSVTEVRSKFAVSLAVQPVPNADDFRIYDGLPQDEVDKLVAMAKKAEIDKFAAASAKAYERLYAVVEHMATQLDAFGKGKIKKFNDSLLGNIAEIVEAMPALNITGDPKLDDFAIKARDLTHYAIVDLRKNEGTRKAAAKEAAVLAKAMAPLAGAGTTVTAAPAVDNPLPQQVVQPAVPKPPVKVTPSSENIASVFADFMGK
jgi:hypothetical protein